MFKWIFLYFNLCPLPVVFWLSTTEKSPAPSYSFPPIRYYIHWQDPPELSLLQADQSWFSQPSCVWESFPGLVAPSPSNRGKVDLPVVFAPPPPPPPTFALFQSWGTSPDHHCLSETVKSYLTMTSASFLSICGSCQVLWTCTCLVYLKVFYPDSPSSLPCSRLSTGLKNLGFLNVSVNSEDWGKEGIKVPWSFPCPL